MLLFTGSVLSNSLRAHGLQHFKLPCPSLSPQVCSNSCPFSRWWIQPSHPLLPPSPPALNLPQHQGLFQWVSSLHQVAKTLVLQASVLPKNSQGWFPLGLTGLISLLSKGLSRVISRTTFQKQQFFGAQPSLWTNSHIHNMTTRKTIVLTMQTSVSKLMSLLFNTLSRFVIAFLPRNKHILISWLQSRFSVILEPKKMKSDTVSIVSPSICHKVIGPDAMILVFWMLNFKPDFSLSSFTFIRRLHQRLFTFYH